MSRSNLWRWPALKLKYVAAVNMGQSPPSADTDEDIEGLPKATLSSERRIQTRVETGYATTGDVTRRALLIESWSQKQREPEPV